VTNKQTIPEGSICGFRLKVKSYPLVPYDLLETSPRRPDTVHTLVDNLLIHGWDRHGFSIPSITPPLEWDTNNRSFSCSLHAWEPLTHLLRGISEATSRERRAQLIKASFIYAYQWIKIYQLPILNHDLSEIVNYNFKDNPIYAWYDMAVGQRIYRLAFLLDVICRDPSYSDLTVNILYQSLHFHHSLLNHDQFFKIHSNHGLYQALGQLAAAKRFAHIDAISHECLVHSKSRLSALIREHFTNDNVHKEHSPGYHWMILGSLIGSRVTNLITESSLSQVVDGMEEAMVWMIKPNNHIVTFGDSDPRKMITGTVRAQRFKDLALQAITSNGDIGVFPKPGVRAYYTAGYAFARLYSANVEQQFDKYSYLAQNAGFHSRVHKHADHLTFVWFDKMRDILIDPGRYAYAGRTERYKPRARGKALP